MNLKPTIGIEVHVELNTLSKVFSNSKNDFKALPNTNVNEVDLSYPGTLPTLNHKVIEYGLKIALALNCKINKEMHFDRKNYFYVDNPKNFQITQNKTPIGYDGYIEINDNGVLKKIEIEELHIEEDTCKSIHGNNKTYLNYNRAGVPLVEIVTKPVIKSSKEAMLYIESLKQTLEHLGVSDVKMEEGSMRCDANVSLSENEVLGEKTEIKNIGSISSVGLAIESEIKRQEALLSNGEVIRCQTRKFDEKKNDTILLRYKETGNDYRYFPEPNIPKVVLTDEYIESVRRNLPVLPNTLRKMFEEYGLTDISKKVLIQNIELCYFFLELKDEGINLINASNYLTGDIVSVLNKNNLKLGETKLTKENYVKLIKRLDEKKISSKSVKELIQIIMFENKDIDMIISENNMELSSNNDALIKVINNILELNSSSVIDYKNGKENAFKFLMGQVMKETKGTFDPSIINEVLKELLTK